MATTFAIAFAIGAPAITADQGSPPAGLTLVAAAAVSWAMAARRRRRLLAMRADWNAAGKRRGIGRVPADRRPHRER
jgi:drug/metabolite transporter (DMT)-like permease